MKKIKRVLYPEKDVYGGGEIVARVYMEDLEYPVYILWSGRTMYTADTYIGVKNSIFVGYNKIGRLKRKINKKVKQGYITEEQGIRCILTTVCNIVEDELGLL